MCSWNVLFLSIMISPDSTWCKKILAYFCSAALSIGKVLFSSSNAFSFSFWFPLFRVFM